MNTNNPDNTPTVPESLDVHIEAATRIVRQGNARETTPPQSDRLERRATKPERRRPDWRTIQLRRLGALAVISALSIGGAIVYSEFQNSAPETQATISYTVGEDEDLWSIAREIDPSRTGEVKQQIMELNGLDSTVIHPGDILEVPQD